MDDGAKGDGNRPSHTATATCAARPMTVMAVSGRGLRRARIAVMTVFFLQGGQIGAWVTRIPSIKDQVGTSVGPLSVALLAAAISGLICKPAIGVLISRFGSRPVVRVGIVASGLALPLPGLAHDLVALGLWLTLFGAAIALLDVSMNAHAVTVQNESGRQVMASFHGLFSVGGLVGSSTGGILAAAGLSVTTHLALVSLVLGSLALSCSSWLLPTQPGHATGRAARYQGRRLPLVLLGLVGLCVVAAEGAVGDWSGIYMRDDLQAAPGLVGWGYSAYSIAMAVGRFCGDAIISRWGERRTVTGGAVAAGTAFGVALVIGQPVAAVSGCAALGLGLSVVMPSIFSWTGRLAGEEPGPAVSLVSGFSGTGLMAGPPLIGFLAEALGLPAALGSISVLAVCAVVLIQLVERTSTHPPEPAEDHRGRKAR